MGGIGSRGRSRGWVCGATLWLCCGGLTACAKDDLGCEEVAGQFLPEYQPLDGTCGWFQPMNVDIPPGSDANRMSNQTGAGGNTVRTTVNVSGCDLRFTQEAFRGQRRAWTIGATLDVVSGEELKGTAYRVEYDENDQEICRSNLGATLRQGWQYGMAGSTAQ